MYFLNYSQLCPTQLDNPILLYNSYMFVTRKLIPNEPINEGNKDYHFISQTIYIREIKYAVHELKLICFLLLVISPAFDHVSIIFFLCSTHLLNYPIDIPLKCRGTFNYNKLLSYIYQTFRKQCTYCGVFFAGKK